MSYNQMLLFCNTSWISLSFSTSHFVKEIVMSILCIIYKQYYGIISLFVLDKCSWLSWLTYANEFTSPRTYTQSLTIICLNHFDYTTNGIKSLKPKKMLATHEHWPLKIRMIPQYLVFKREFCIKKKPLYFVCNLTSNIQFSSIIQIARKQF